MPTNTAAWINAKHAPLEVGPAPYTPPGDDQIVIRNHAVAVNPLDWIIQVAGNLAYRWLTYPTVLGSDVAGEVVEVGQAVTRFRVGDRVLGHAVGTDKDSNSAAEGAFQHYTVVLERLAAPIPDTLPFEDAAVLPLAVSTAACGLFQTRPAGAAAPVGERRADRRDGPGVGRFDQRRQQRHPAGGRRGLRGRHHGLAAQLRLRQVARRRRRSSTTTARASSPDIIAALKGRTLAGAIAFGTTSADSCVRIVGACDGQQVRVHRQPAGLLRRLADAGRGRLAAAAADRCGSSPPTWRCSSGPGPRGPARSTSSAPR